MKHAKIVNALALDIAEKVHAVRIEKRVSDAAFQALNEAAAQLKIVKEERDNYRLENARILMDVVRIRRAVLQASHACNCTVKQRKAIRDAFDQEERVYCDVKSVKKAGA